METPDGDSHFRVVDVSEKPVSKRRAVATGRIRLEEAAFLRVRAGTVPKGDPLVLAEVAGLTAAKRTPELLPLCHPISFDAAEVHARLDEEARIVEVRAEVRGTGRTGYEMEALTAVSAALLCVYDMTKALGPGAVIEGIRLEEKEGGKHGHWKAGNIAGKTPSLSLPALSGVTAAVVTVSDRVSSGLASDQSGPAAVRWLERCGVRDIVTRVVADDRAALVSTFRSLASEVSLVIATGGTGLGPRDVTPEAMMEVCDRMIPGFGEKLREEGRRKTPFAYLSRSVAGLCRRTVLVALPGKPSAVDEGLDALGPLLRHAIDIAAGGDHAPRGEAR